MYQFNTALVDYQLRMSAEYAWLYAAWCRMTEDEKNVIVENARILYEHARRHRLGVCGAIEVVAKVGMFLALSARSVDVQTRLELL